MYKIKNKSIILASSSSSRRNLLENAGVEFLVRPSNVDEEPIKASAISENRTLKECATLLSEIKGTRISHQFPEDYVISSDQILEFEGRCFSKPNSLNQAKSQLNELQGNTHILHTSVVVFLQGQRIWHHLSSPKVTLRPLTETEIEDYFQAIGNNALNTPGSYQIENYGCHIMSSYSGSFYDILGLPLLPLLEFLRLHGLALMKKNKQ